MKTEDLLEKGLTQEQVNFVMQENGKDLNKLQKEIDDWKKKAEDAEKNFNAKEAER